jgi:hypothetical protein
MNNKFNRLNKPRITRFAPSLIGHSIPERTKGNTSTVGVYIDNLVRKWAGASTEVTSGVDLAVFGIEVKSQDIQTGSSWTIGTMTFEDILDTEYVDSSLYQKLQALFLVRYDNKLRIITDANLYYLDNDEIQSILKEAYDTARQKAIDYYVNSKSTLSNKLIVFSDESIEFNNSQQFKGPTGYCFEFTNSGTSFKFRITGLEMNRLIGLSTANNNRLFNFA